MCKLPQYKGSFNFSYMQNNRGKDLHSVVYHSSMCAIYQIPNVQWECENFALHAIKAGLYIRLSYEN